MERVTIERMDQSGDGIAMHGGKPLRIARTLPGEIVDVSDGRLMRIHAPSPERVEAFCPKFLECGGCKLQHWSERSYAQWKRSLIEAALAANSLQPAIDPLIDAHGAGRRRVTLHVREQGARWAAGFMEQKSHRLCALETCPVLVSEMKDAPGIAASFGPVLGACDVSITAADNGLDVSVKAERKASPRRLDALRELFQSWQLLRLAINGDEFMATAQPFVQMGKAQVRLPVQSFLQATREGERVLSRLVMEGLGKCRKVADLFCGVGPFTFRLAEGAAVHGFDADKNAIVQLKHAARNTQGLKPISADARDLFRNPLVAAELNGFDGLVFDPPRAGAEAQARMIAKSDAKKVVAVACDVRTFARDSGLLVAGGYRLERVVPIDQFKWTSHLEIVGWFGR